MVLDWRGVSCMSTGGLEDKRLGTSGLFPKPPASFSDPLPQSPQGRHLWRFTLQRTDLFTVTAQFINASINDDTFNWELFSLILYRVILIHICHICITYSILAVDFFSTSKTILGLFVAFFHWQTSTLVSHFSHVIFLDVDAIMRTKFRENKFFVKLSEMICTVLTLITV